MNMIGLVIDEFKSLNKSVSLESHIMTSSGIMTYVGWGRDKPLAGNGKSRRGKISIFRPNEFCKRMDRSNRMFSFSYFNVHCTALSDDAWCNLTLLRLGYFGTRETVGGSKRPTADISSTICSKRLKLGMRGPGSKMRSPKVQFSNNIHYRDRTTHLHYATLTTLRLSKYTVRTTDFGHQIGDILLYYLKYNKIS